MWLTKHGDTTSGAKLRRGQVSGAGQGMTIQGESEYRSPELLFPYGYSTAPVEDCRDTVASRMAARPGDFTQAGTQRLLPGAGVRGLVLEDGEGGLKVLLGRLLGITQAEAARELDQLLPAHLAWAWDTAVTWVALDAYPRSFEAWDDLGLTWAQLDGVSRQDLENGFEEV